MNIFLIIFLYLLDVNQDKNEIQSNFKFNVQMPTKPIVHSNVFQINYYLYFKNDFLDMKR